MADEVYRGVTWNDFPGKTKLDKKDAFLSFKRGKSRFNNGTKGLEGDALRARILEIANRDVTINAANSAKAPHVIAFRTGVAQSNLTKPSLNVMFPHVSNPSRI